MSRLTEPLRARIQETLSGQQSGVPAWVSEFETGTDRGFFGPESAVWAVHGGMPTLVAGIRALLMQALHPGALAGVYDRSRFREDPLGRLNGTIRWIFTVSYGDTTQAVARSDWVKRLHEHVVGEYIDGRGSVARYTANDPHLSAWVHLAFMDSFLTAHEIWGGPIPGGAGAYVDQWSIAGDLMGVPDPPHSKAELKAALHGFADAGELRCDDRTREVVAFVRHAPVRASLRPSYAVLFAGAVASLEPRFRDMLGLRMPRLGPIQLPVIPVTGLVLKGAGSLLGQTAGEKAALVRLAALGDG